MENNDNIREQLDSEVVVQTAAADSVDMGTDTTKSSSPYGKFKDADSLYSAYNELQSEFTRKCQRLSELESKVVDNVESSAPTCDDTNWQDYVNEFLKTHKHAMLYSKDISEELIKDKSLKGSKHGLEIAYSKVLENKHRTLGDIIKDEAFLKDYVYSNEDIKKEIINNYLKSLNRAPTILGETGQGVTLTPYKKPTSLSEARSVVEDMLKN